MLVGVLALQGDFSKHEDLLRSLGIEVRLVRKPEDSEGCDGLIIPGGESTVIMRHLEFIEMRKVLVDFAKHKPVFGTCAGLILMSKTIQGSPFEPLTLLDITVARNSYGRQVESFQASIPLQLKPNHEKLFKAFFIRAPRIRENGSDVKVLATYRGEAVLVRQGHHLGASFHPELTADPTIHQYFLTMIRESKGI